MQVNLTEGNEGNEEKVGFGRAGEFGRGRAKAVNWDVSKKKDGRMREKLGWDRVLKFFLV
jgi:hypothetical protein